MKIRISTLLLVVLVSASPGLPPEETPLPSSSRVEAPGLHNVYRITDKLLSGSAPDGEEGFRSLQQLGVRTIISVDGARPDLALAHKYHMRYVHLPFGYDGVPADQGLRLARAVHDLPGLIYLHCHHGMHRGPAAAAVVHRCLDGHCTLETALAELRRAGTDPRYTGLYAAPAQFHLLTDRELDRIPADFPEVAPVPALPSLMVGIDERWDRLKQVQAAGWRVPPDHPDLDPPHEALQLEESFHEAGRLPRVGHKPEEFRRWLAEAEEETQTLEGLLRTGKDHHALDGPAADKVFGQVAAACVRCHGKYRDVPQK